MEEIMTNQEAAITWRLVCIPPCYAALFIFPGRAMRSSPLVTGLEALARSDEYGNNRVQRQPSLRTSARFWQSQNREAREGALSTAKRKSPDVKRKTKP